MKPTIENANKENKNNNKKYEIKNVKSITFLLLKFTLFPLKLTILNLSTYLQPIKNEDNPIFSF